MEVAAIFATWFAVSTIASMFSEDKEFIEQAVESGLLDNTPGPGETKLTGPKAWLAVHIPVVEGMPWTAPIFNAVFKIVTFPWPHCVVIVDNFVDQCQCYTQQVTRMLDVDDRVCRQIATQGWFDPTKSDRTGRERAQREPPSRSRQSRNRNSGDATARGTSKYRLRSDPVRSKFRDREDLRQYDAERASQSN